MQHNRRFVTADNVSLLFFSFPNPQSSILGFVNDVDFQFSNFILFLVCVILVVGFGKKRGPNSSEK
uniref:Uncharacterized protein n=1 Tax=Lotus japonicus TaxID=34305 RepID=I3T3S9_LOTJA|nr:unknown [Lotus japonicus]